MASMLFLVGALLCFLALIISISRIRKDEFDELPDDVPEQSRVKAMEFNGKTLYLSESDLTVWNKLNNKQKQDVHLKQLSAIKQGLLIKVTDEHGNDGLITRREALDKGVLVRYVDKKGVTSIIRKEELEKIKREM